MYVDCHAHACLYINGCDDRNYRLVLVALDVCEVALYHWMSALVCIVMLLSLVCLFSVRILRTSSCV